MERPTAVAQLRSGPVEYRFEARGDDTVLIFHGGHLRAGLPLGEEVFAQLGFSVLAPSRPGYGRTPVHADSSPEGFAATSAELSAHLGIERLAAVVAMSAGGRTALALAADHPDLVATLILEAAVGFEPWPDRRTRVGAEILFNRVSEKAVWAVVHTMMRRAPKIGLLAMMSSLSTLPATKVVDAFSVDERATLVSLLSRMRSGRGFSTDLRFARRAASATTIRQPALVIASRGDGQVPVTQAESVIDHLENGTLVVVDTNSHLLWFGPGSGDVSDRIRTFLSPDR